MFPSRWYSQSILVLNISEKNYIGYCELYNQISRAKSYHGNLRGKFQTA